MSRLDPGLVVVAMLLAGCGSPPPIVVPQPPLQALQRADEAEWPPVAALEPIRAPRLGRPRPLIPPPSEPTEEGWQRMGTK